MGRAEFYAWVEQAAREQKRIAADDPDSWEGVDDDAWWSEAREKRKRQQAR